MATSTLQRRRSHQRSRSNRASLPSTFRLISSSIDRDWLPALPKDDPTEAPIYELEERPFYSNRDSLSSNLTLVNPSPSLRVVFDRNSVLNAILYSDAGPVFRIKTTNHMSRTDIWDLSDSTEQKVVATWKRRDFLPDLVVLRHRRKKAIRIRKWLKKRKPGERYIFLLQFIHPYIDWKFSAISLSYEPRLGTSFGDRIQCTDLP